MSRLAVSVLLLVSGLTTAHNAATTTSHTFPAVTPSAQAAGKHRPAPFRVDRSMQRLPVPHPAVTPRSAPPARVTLTGARQLLTVTAYCWTGSRNAAGNWPTIGTAAANAYPLGTRLHVQGVGVVTVEDRSAPGATDVDLYIGDDSSCAARAAVWGRRQLLVGEAA